MFIILSRIELGPGVPCRPGSELRPTTPVHRTLSPPPPRKLLARSLVVVAVGQPVVPFHALLGYVAGAHDRGAAERVGREQVLVQHVRGRGA